MRRWDSYPAYLFDLDGTLLQCADAVHYFGFCRALEILAERPLNLEGVTAHGNTDLGIIRDAMAIATIPETLWRPRLSAALTAMQQHVTHHQDEIDANPIPGAMLAIEHLQSKGALVGVATGNLEVIGRLKLQRAGFMHNLQFGSFSDELETREAVFERALRSLPAHILPADTCFVGDTPRDIQAARHCGSPVIAVATGTYDLHTLQSFQPDYCVTRLSELL